MVYYMVHVPNFGGCQGRRTRVGVTTVSNSLILGGWVTKGFKNGDEKEGGGRVGDNNILTFFILLSRQKNVTLKNAFWAIFSIRICKVS